MEGGRNTVLYTITKNVILVRDSIHIQSAPQDYAQYAIYRPSVCLSVRHTGGGHSKQLKSGPVCHIDGPVLTIRMTVNFPSPALPLLFRSSPFQKSNVQDWFSSILSRDAQNG